MDQILTLLVMGQPLWLWLTFLAVVAVLLTVDLGVLHTSAREIGVRESLALSAFCVSLGLAVDSVPAIFAILASGIGYSIWRTRERA